MDSQNNAGTNQENAQQNTQQTNSGAPGSSNANQNNAAQSVSNHTILAVLSYLGPLVIISYVLAKDNDFVKFHIRQGLVVFGIEVASWLLGSVFYPFYIILKLVDLATLILSIIGIINVVQGHKKELPVVGSLAHSIKI